jgi:N-acetyltransferase 10
MDHISISEGHTGIDDEKADTVYIEDPGLTELKISLADTPNVGSLVSLAKTLDQANVVMSFLDAISEKTYRSTVTLTAGRGRGKSAAIGMCLAGNICDL